MMKKMEEEIPVKAFYCRVGKNPVLPIGPHVIKEKNLQIVAEVIKYLGTLPELKSAMEYQREAIFDGQIRHTGDMISDFQTSEENPLYLFMKYIGEPSLSASKAFFEERDIDFQVILNSAKLSNSLEQIIIKDYVTELKPIQDVNKVSTKRIEVNKGKVIYMILTKTIDVDKDEPFMIDDDFSITPDITHNAKADHAIINSLTGIPLLITEDKNNDIIQGIQQNFDQLRSFSMTSKGKNIKVFSGLATDLQNWIFTCFIRPEGMNPVSVNNFHVSQPFVLTKEKGNLDDAVLLTLIRIIRGYITKGIEELAQIITSGIGQ